MSKPRLSEYRALANFRYEIRKFLAFSEAAARAAGIEPQHHQLLLAVHGLPEGVRPTIGALAERLCLKHHTTVGLVDKLEERGLAVRVRSDADRREVLVSLTADGTALLRRLSQQHRDELRNAGVSMVAALTEILDTRLD